MSRGPLVSIVIPTYNQAQFVDDAIRSAVLQDYEALEVVVCDDGSTDETSARIRRWVREYPDKVVGLIDQPHLGITGNCNRGLQACRGDYVAFGAGDDVFLPGKISAQVAWFERDPLRVLCGHDVELFDSDSNRRLSLWSDRYPLHAGTGAARVVCGSSFASTSVMVRRTAIPAYGFDERLPVSSDSKLWIDCLHAGGRYGYVDGLYGRYRRHAGNLTNVNDQSKGTALFSDMLSFHAIVAAQYPDLAPLCERTRARVCWVRADWHLRRGEKEEALPFLREALTHFGRSHVAANLLTRLMLNGRLLPWAMDIRRAARSAFVAVRGSLRRRPTAPVAVRNGRR